MADHDSASSYRFVIAALTIWVHFAAGLNFQAISPILPLVTEDYGISYSTAGLLVGVVLVLVGIMGIPGAMIVGRVRLWRVYAISWFSIGLLSLSALSPGFEGLLTLRILYGLGVTALMPATGTLMMLWFRPRELPVITSVNMASMTLGMMASIASIAPLSDLVGWERALGMFGGVGLAGAFAWLRWGRAPDAARSIQSGLDLREAWAVIKQRTIMMLGLADAACFSMYMALSSWLPTYYNETRGMSLNEAGLVVSILPFMGIFAILLGGFLPLRFGDRWMYLVFPGIMAGLGGLGTFVLEGTAFTYGSVAVLGMGAWLYIPTIMTMPMTLAGMTPQRVAMAWGWIMTASGLAGFVAPLVVGWLRDEMGSFVPGFAIFCGLAWFLVVTGLMLPRLTRPAADHATQVALEGEVGDGDS